MENPCYRAGDGQRQLETLAAQVEHSHCFERKARQGQQQSERGRVGLTYRRVPYPYISIGLPAHITPGFRWHPLHPIISKLWRWSCSVNVREWSGRFWPMKLWDARDEPAGQCRRRLNNGGTSSRTARAHGEMDNDVGFARWTGPWAQGLSNHITEVERLGGA